jgi:hypothetical protein
MDFLGILVDIWRVYSGLGPNCKYFSETEGPAEKSLGVQGLRVDLQQAPGPNCKSAWIMEFPDLFSNGKFHGPGPRRINQAACSGPWCPWAERITGVAVLQRLKAH